MSDLVKQRLCVADPPPVIVARQLDIARLWDVTGKISSSLYWDAPVTTAMKHQRWNADLWQLGTNIGITNSLQDGFYRARTRGQALYLRPPLAKSFVMRACRREVLQINRPAPTFHQFLRPALILLWRQAPRIIRTANTFCLTTVEHQTRNTVQAAEPRW